MTEPIARHTITHDGQDLTTPGLTKPGNSGGDLLAPLLPAGEPVEQLLRKAQFFVPGGQPSPDFREVHRAGGRGAEEFYRERWRHDKVVRSTHGVNCTGSCSWKVYVKDGIITWETQQTDYPSTGPDSPEYEPRGCPRGASFSWYTYSPSRVRYPYVRGALLELWREAKAAPRRPGGRLGGDHRRPGARPPATSRPAGKGGFVRSTWPEVTRADRRRARAHGQGVRPGPGGGVLPDPGDVAGVLRGRNPVPVDDRRDDPVVLRLVRGHAGRVAAGVRRPDRRARVRRTGGTPPT